MLKENWRLVTRMERVCDVSIIVLMFFAAYYGREFLGTLNNFVGAAFSFNGPALAPIKDYTIVLLVALITYPLTLHVLGTYSSMRLRSGWQLARIFVVASLINFFVFSSVLFLLKLNLSRSFLILFCSLMAVALMAERALVLRSLRFLRKQGFNFRTVMICGFSGQAVRLARAIALKPELGIRVRAFADLRPREQLSGPAVLKFRTALRSAGIINMGRLAFGVQELETAIKDYAIDEVIFTDLSAPISEIEEAVVVCAEQGIRTTIAADLFSIGLVKSGISYFGDIPLIHFQTPPGDRWELGLKRVIDVAVSGLALVLLSPLFVALALAVKLSSPGPVFFVQKRMGLNGRIFSMYKFRTMFDGAEKTLGQLLEKNQMSGPAFKIKNDPRITAVGRFLRKYSLDELPQIWNVFKGEMSLVGPRPPIPGEVSRYERRYRRRLSMRPGLTCIWQVKGRSQISAFDAWVQMDLDYIDNWSLMNDFRLIVRTIPAVLTGNGAH